MNLSAIAVAHAALGEPAKKSGAEVFWTCPRHDDAKPSLQVNARKNAWACFPCDAGGTAWQLAAWLLNVSPTDKASVLAWLKSKNLVQDAAPVQKRQIVAQYSYRDERGALLFQTVRYVPKVFKQRRPDGSGGWVWNLDGVRLVPYRLPEVLKAAEVFVVEGERDADELGNWALCATTNPMGAGKWRREFSEHLRGKDVVILPDNDAPGARHAEQVAVDTLPGAASVCIVRLPGLGPGGDFSDSKAAGGSRDKLLALVRAAAVYEPPAAEAPAPEASQDAAAGIDGAALVRELETFYARFLVLPAGALLPVALWTLATHCYQSWDAFPYLAVVSPVKQCGKTRLTEVLELLAANARRTVNISEAALFRLIEKTSPTLILDEAEALNGKSERAEALRALLNSGNRKGASVPRCVGSNHDVKEFSVYCPKVLAGIGACPETVRDRSIVLSMQRKKRTDAVERFRHRTVAPPAAALRARALDFIERCRPEMEEAYSKVDLPFLSDRDEEAWGPLFAVLAVADPARLVELRDSAERLTASKAAVDVDDSLSLHLLADVRATWTAGDRTTLTAEMLARLAALEESPWREEVPVNARKLARMLRPFGVGSQLVRTGEKVGRGYRLEDLEAAFSRYLTPENVRCVTSL